MDRANETNGRIIHKLSRCVSYKKSLTRLKLRGIRPFFPFLFSSSAFPPRRPFALSSFCSFPQKPSHGRNFSVRQTLYARCRATIESRFEPATLDVGEKHPSIQIVSGPMASLARFNAGKSIAKSKATPLGLYLLDTHKDLVHYEKL
jgi:hypothetical protein